MTPTKHCDLCGLAYSRSHNENSPDWRRRRYCGVACAQEALRGKRRKPEAAR